MFVLHTGGTIGSLIDSSNSVKFDPTFLRKRIADSKLLIDLNDTNRATELFHCNERPFILKTGVRFHEAHPDVAAIAFYLLEYDPQFGSEDLRSDDWMQMIETVTSVYNEFDGIVVMHGTNTLAYTASMFSFMLQVFNF